MIGLYSLPAALTWLRILLGPVLLILALYSPRPIPFAVCLSLGFLSDVFDGIVARRLKVATPGLRRLDSVADSIFYLCAFGAAIWLHPDVIAANLALVVILVALEIARYLVDLRKFGRETSYHMWTSKLWGISLFVGFFGILVLERGGVFAVAPLALGIVADLEGLLISFTLKSWRHDVPTIFHARRLRRFLEHQNEIVGHLK